MDTILGRYKNLVVLAAILFAQIIALAVQVKRPAQDGETRLLRGPRHLAEPCPRVLTPRERRDL